MRLINVKENYTVIICRGLPWLLGIALSGTAFARDGAPADDARAAGDTGWFSHWGSARAQFNVDEDIHLDDRSIDLLVPVYDSGQTLFITQLSGRRRASRDTYNIVAGVRTLVNNWMFGLNTFFDDDVTGGNRRSGVGGEIGTHYLKLSANLYLRSGDWHPSRDFANNAERPANGYDIRAEAYLPAYPQLGARLIFEQYMADNVALFGKENRLDNLRAATGGLTYTPIPLLTFGVDHRKGSARNSDSHIGIQFTYRLGETWQYQIDPSAVDSARRLPVSRFDPVERNGNVLLDYQH